MSDTSARSVPVTFPVGYHDLHPDISINFQLNRFYGWVGDDSMLTEMREAAASVAGVQDYPIFTKTFLERGDKALARHEVLKGAYYLRLAEFFLFAKEPRKLPTRQRFVDLLLGHFQIPSSACSRIAFEGGWLPAYRLTPAQPKGTFVVFGGFDSYIEEWLPSALFFRDAGYDTILFEGPGQGAALELAHLTMSPEWQKPVKAVLDFFHLDAVTLMGFSLGGGLVIRAAAFEPRVRRVIPMISVPNSLSALYAHYLHPRKKSSAAGSTSATRERSTSSAPKPWPRACSWTGRSNRECTTAASRRHMR